MKDTLFDTLKIPLSLHVHVYGHMYMAIQKYIPQSGGLETKELLCSTP